MPLTNSQLASLRNRIGDTNPDTPDISDDRLQELYAEFGDFTRAMLEAAYERLGILANEVDLMDSNHLITERRKQRFDMLEKIIARLEAQTGMSGGALSVGTIDLNIDTDAGDMR